MPETPAKHITPDDAKPLDDESDERRPDADPLDETTEHEPLEDTRTDE